MINYDDDDNINKTHFELAKSPCKVRLQSLQPRTAAKKTRHSGTTAISVNVVPESPRLRSNFASLPRQSTQSLSEVYPTANHPVIRNWLQ